MMIKVKIKNVYGSEKIYPACDKAQIFAHMLEQSTLTKSDIARIKELGFSVEVIQELTTL